MLRLLGHLQSRSVFTLLTRSAAQLEANATSKDGTVPKRSSRNEEEYSSKEKRTSKTPSFSLIPRQMKTVGSYVLLNMIF